MNLNNNTTNNKSTKDLKDQVLADIKKVRNDIEEIQNRMTPGQIIDDAIYYRRDISPGETFIHLKNNPIGTSFLTLGTLLLMEDAEHHTFEKIAHEKAVEMKGRVNGMVSDVKRRTDKVQNKVAQVKDNLQEKFQKHKDSDVFKTNARNDESFISEKRVDSFDEIKSNVRGGMDTAKGKLGDVKEKAKERIDSARDQIKDAYQKASSTVGNLDPLTYLVLGAGLGTITGAAIPLSDKEEKFVDDKFQGKVTGFRQDLEEALNQSANILKNEFIGGVTKIKLNLF